MGIFRPIAKLEVKIEAWRWRRNRDYTVLERTPAEPEWWELVMEREKKNRKAERKAAKAARKAAKEERRAAKERERQTGEFDWRDYIPRFPKVVGYTPLWKIDEMLASGNGVRWE